MLFAFQSPSTINLLPRDLKSGRIDVSLYYAWLRWVLVPDIRRGRWLWSGYSTFDIRPIRSDWCHFEWWLRYLRVLFHPGDCWVILCNVGKKTVLYKVLFGYKKHDVSTDILHKGCYFLSADTTHWRSRWQSHKYWLLSFHVYYYDVATKFVNVDNWVISSFIIFLVLQMASFFVLGRLLDSVPVYMSVV